MDYNTSFFCQSLVVGVMASSAVISSDVTASGISAVAALLVGAGAWRDSSKEISERLNNRAAECQASAESKIAGRRLETILIKTPDFVDVWQRTMHKVYGVASSLAAIGLGTASYVSKDHTIKSLTITGAGITAMYAFRSGANILADRVMPSRPNAALHNANPSTDLEHV